MGFISHLNNLPDGLIATEKLIADFDDCFLVGFANLESQGEQTLESLKRIFSGTPLENKLNEAITSILSNEFLDTHFITLAAVRASLQGCIFDTLKIQVMEALGRKVTPETASQMNEIETTEFPQHLQSLTAGVRHWLMEIALVGYSRLETSAIVPFSTSLEKIQEDPLLTRQSALLTGFFNELMKEIPAEDSSKIPIYRWVDLWTSAMIGTLSLPQDLSTPSSTANQIVKVSGELELLGLDIGLHHNLINLVFYGILEGNNLKNNFKQMVRVNFSAYKVDVIKNNDIWLLFPQVLPLLSAMSKGDALMINNMPLLPTGDILWTGEATFGNVYSLMKKAVENFAIGADGITIFSTKATDKHPILIAEPVFLDNYKIVEDGNNLKLIWQDEGELRIASERLSSLSEITTEVIKQSNQIFGLLRFDAGHWAIQPLSILVKGKIIITVNLTSVQGKNSSKSNTLTILQERASRLLRAKT